jgi:hypothetical protein
MTARTAKRKREERNIRSLPVLAAIPLDLGSFDSIREIVDVLNGSHSRWIRGLSKAAAKHEGRQVPDEKWLEAEMMVGSLLRSYVDSWINTGLYPHGEIPGARALGPIAVEALNLYVQSAPPRIGFYELMRVAPSITFGEPESWEPAWEFIDPVFFAEREAIRLFSVLLLSGARQTLCKCRYERCGKYFQKKEDARALYINGTFCCPAHNRAQSARKLTAGRREECNTRLVGFAAEKLLEWRGKSLPWQRRNEPMRTWLTSKINGYISADHSRVRNEIKPNWLKWHWAEIEERIAQIKAKDKKQNPEDSKRMLSCGHKDNWPRKGYLMETCTQLGMSADQMARYYPLLDPKRAICRECKRREAQRITEEMTASRGARSDFIRTQTSPELNRASK